MWSEKDIFGFTFSIVPCPSNTYIYIFFFKSPYGEMQASEKIRVIKKCLTYSFKRQRPNSSQRPTLWCLQVEWCFNFLDTVALLFKRFARFTEGAQERCFITKGLLHK